MKTMKKSRFSRIVMLATVVCMLACTLLAPAAMAVEANEEVLATKDGESWYYYDVEAGHWVLNIARTDGFENLNIQLTDAAGLSDSFPFEVQIRCVQRTYFRPEGHVVFYPYRGRGTC